MRKFRVIYKSGEYVSATIEAKNAQEAEAIAEKMDGGDFTPLMGGNSYIWRHERTEEIKN